MDRHMQAAVHIKIRTILVIILSALITSIILTIVFPHRTRALGLDTVQSATNLLQQTTAPVVTPLVQAISPSQAVAPAQSFGQTSVPSSTPAVASPSSTSTPITIDPSSSSVAEPTTSGAPLMNAELQKIQFSKAHTNSSQSGKQYAYSEQTSSSLLSLWVQPSDEGWKLLGILWYWWTLLAMYIATALLAWKGNANWSLMRLWLSLQHKIYV